MFEYLAIAEPADIIIANLFLHHFQPPQITDIFTRCAKLAPVLIALEPRRATLPLLGSRLVGLLGCNHVSRHDAVSERACRFPRQRAVRVVAKPTRLEFR